MYHLQQVCVIDETDGEEEATSCKGKKEEEEEEEEENCVHLSVKATANRQTDGYDDVYDDDDNDEEDVK